VNDENTYTFFSTPHFVISVNEHKDAPACLLVRVSSQAVLSLGFDVSPEDALKLAEALTKHAKALQGAKE
jgi:hypothetical protein